MEKRMVQLFCTLNLTAVVFCAAENAKFRKTTDCCENSLHTKKYSDLRQLIFSVIDEDLVYAFSENSQKNSSKCLGDIMYTLQNIRSLCAMKLFDSYGKPESGILHGNTKWFGAYNECLNVNSINPNSTFGNFKGMYCIATLTFNITYMNTPLNVSSAVCIPDSCSPEEFQEHAMKLLKKSGLLSYLNGKESIIRTFSLQCLPRERHLNNSTIVMIVVLFFIFALNVAGSSITAFKYFKEVIQGYKNTPVAVTKSIVECNEPIEDQKDTNMRKENDISLLQDHLLKSRTEGTVDKLKSFLNCFCIFTNGSKVLNTNTSEGELLCIHGIRFLSMCWIIFGHTLIFGKSLIRNFLAVKEEYADSLFFQVIQQGHLFVDSFFVLSGFLVAYYVLKYFAKSNGRLPWSYFYIHRYIRLTPTYMIILGFYTTVFAHMGSGPFWAAQDFAMKCEDHWWRNLLYINNFCNFFDQCMPHTWYLASDMQFYIISPLYLITLWRRPKIGYFFIAISILACCLCNFFITYHFELMDGWFNATDLTESLKKMTEHANRLYVKPYTRISTYLIGILTAYLLHKRKRNNSSKHSLAFMCIGWMVSISLYLTCVFLLYNQKPQLLVSSFYNAFNRTAYSFSLAWVIYACCVGQGGFVNKILSYKLFIPLGRITYTAFLIHPLIIYGYFNSMKAWTDKNSLTFFYLLCGFLAATYALSLPVSIMLESPVIELEKWFKKRFSKQTGMTENIIKKVK